MHPIRTAEIFAIGSELLTPLRTDTNSIFLTRKLNEIGVEVRRKTVVGDDVDDLVDAIEEAFVRTDLLITMGGLGPTEDDRTREALSQATGRRLVRHDPWVDYLRERFGRFGRQLADNNLRQADLLEGAELLPNPVGTAPGQWIRGYRCAILVLPGPPRELHPMFEREALPRISRAAPGHSIQTRILRVTGMTESHADSLVGPIYRDLVNPSVTILASPGTIELHLRALPEPGRPARVILDEVESKLREKLGDRVYGVDEDSLESVVGAELRRRKLTIATAESCTGGLLAARLTEVPGSSEYFLRGFICYSNRAKTEDLGVPAELIDSHGAVSELVAAAMATGARQRAGADIGIGITGIAGPAGGTDVKPVGLVYIAVASELGVESIENRFLGERALVRFQATQRALDRARLILRGGSGA